MKLIKEKIPNSILKFDNFYNDQFGTIPKSENSESFLNLVIETDY